MTKHLSNNNFQLSFILINPGVSEIETFLIKNNFSCIRIKFRGYKDLPKAILKVFQIFRESKPDIIHCHLFNASLIGLLAGRLAGIRKRIYTRHHSTYNHQYNKKGVALDKIINYLATDIVAISKNVETILIEKESVPKNKIHLIHHGFDLSEFENIDSDQINELRKKYQVTGNPVIGVIARWIEWKGVQFIIPAFKKLLEDYPQGQLILANANGPYTSKIKVMLKELPEESYRIIPFEENLFELYQLFDVYVHTPIDPSIEAFGQTYVEALAAEIPSVFTLSGVAPEFIENEKNALIVPYMNSEAILESINKILQNKNQSINLKKEGKLSLEKFELEIMIKKLEQLYQNA